MVKRRYAKVSRCWNLVSQLGIYTFLYLFLPLNPFLLFTENKKKKKKKQEATGDMRMIGHFGFLPIIFVWRIYHLLTINIFLMVERALAGLPRSDRVADSEGKKN